MKNADLDKATMWILILSVVAVIVVTAYIFLYKKDYNFIIEASCDQTTEKCYVRECSTEENCAIAEVEYFQVYTVKARDFSGCTNVSCPECSSGMVQCRKVECGQTEEDQCTQPEEINSVYQAETTTIPETVASPGVKQLFEQAE